MSEQKHYHYEGHVELKMKPKEIEVTDVCFLTPARVTAKIDGQETNINVSIDLVNRKVYENNEESAMTNKVFEHLDMVAYLPDDFFGAPEDVIEDAEKAQDDHDSIKERMSDV
jgi:hypothetical protein